MVFHELEMTTVTLSWGTNDLRPAILVAIVALHPKIFCKLPVCIHYPWVEEEPAVSILEKTGTQHFIKP